MIQNPPRIELVERDKRLLERIFENRVMSISQISAEFFPQLSRQNISRRLVKLKKHGFLDWHVVCPAAGNRLSVYSVTQKALGIVRERYRFRIVKDFCKSDSVEHDIQLVEVRKRLHALQSVADYYTENMLQACEEFSGKDSMAAFVRNNTDAVLEVRKNGKITVVGLEFERSEKGLDRYAKKLLSYYTDPRTAVILYVCRNAAIQKTLARAEASIMGKGPPRCFYALLENVLQPNGKCIFTNLKGATITLE